MANYHLFCFSGAELFRSDDIEASDDAEAFRRAFFLRGRASAELWIDDRKIADFHAIPPDEADSERLSRPPT